MKIGELAKKTGCDVETIRFYEKSGLLDEPVRTGSGYRDYQASHFERLQFIRRCRSLRIGLQDIRTLLGLQASPTAGCEHVNALLDQHIAAIQSQMAALRTLEEQLVALRRQCNEPHSVEECAILQNLADRVVQGNR
ncbi:Cd(II)/Pb(II)-responsive transcriptional regulator [Pseudoduganella chitinolytica]|uniref:Cd(II)/Pb(II)-responsive transcriptional regulator n=1 Tax=Pseudoduganella chitinolytica TaxID=34070 RepID=A0ABY8B4Z7_9BURK|nr:Cd(II)/Pb(II)-responsive transcriptional regulator [Pseudoduganella chitinolytica]WEF31019.1 Cd(II)/Pb(II)-responsive transcriptional regulator [Pseudoduganella chitinolytica]